MKLRRTWEEGRAGLGGWCVLPGSVSAEVMARSGFDYVCVDCQHGLIGYDAMVPMLQAIALGGSTPFVRVPWNRPEEIMKALDAGAKGVIVPMVNSREEARAAVAACRYPPAGIRSWGPVRAAMGVSDFGPDSANADVICVVMVETVEAMDDLEEIVSTPGVDVVYVGPNDLSLTHGMAPSVTVDEEAHLGLVERVLDSCRRNSVVAGIHCGGAVTARRWSDAGFRFITVDSDYAFIAGAAGQALAKVRG